MTRLERLQAALERPLLVTNEVNVRYLTGFRSSNAALLVEPKRVRLCTDSRYTAAAKLVPGVEVVEIGRDRPSDLSDLLEGDTSFEAEYMSVATFKKLRSGGASLVPVEGLVERLRAVKDVGELEAIRRAAEVTSEAYRRLASEPFRDRREVDLAWRMRELFHELGAEDEAFPTIAASGPNGAFVHGEPTERVVQEGDLILVDAGAALDGYCADCTRTFACGEPADELRRAYEVCLAAQEAGVAAVRTGALAREVDAASRGIVDESEFAGLFGHGLGHGVGIEVHEAPYLRKENDETRLEAGNVVTVEPGIYIEGLGGVRIEDLVIVTEDGAEVLTTFPKQLTVVG
jgi:Xaa-Pro aminopeptidase